MKMKRGIGVVLVLTMMVSLMACGKVDEVSQKVMNDIDNLGEITMDDEVAIDKIVATYATLTDSQKNQVKNYATLLEAQDKIEAIRAEAEAAELAKREAWLSIERDYYDDVQKGIKELENCLKNPSSMEVTEVVVCNWCGDKTVYIEANAANGFGNISSGTYSYDVKLDWLIETNLMTERRTYALEGNDKYSYEIGEKFHSNSEDISASDAIYFFVVDFDDYQANGYSLKP